MEEMDANIIPLGPAPWYYKNPHPELKQRKGMSMFQLVGSCPIHFFIFVNIIINISIENNSLKCKKLRKKLLMSYFFFGHYVIDMILLVVIFAFSTRNALNEPREIAPFAGPLTTPNNSFSLVERSTIIVIAFSIIASCFIRLFEDFKPCSTNFNFLFWVSLIVWKCHVVLFGWFAGMSRNCSSRDPLPSRTYTTSVSEFDYRLSVNPFDSGDGDGDNDHDSNRDTDGDGDGDHDSNSDTDGDGDGDGDHDSNSDHDGDGDGDHDSNSDHDGDGDGEGDHDSNSDTDGDGDGDGDHDSNSDTDGDGDGDGDDTSEVTLNHDDDMTSVVTLNHVLQASILRLNHLEHEGYHWIETIDGIRRTIIDISKLLGPNPEKIKALADTANNMIENLANFDSENGNTQLLKKKIDDFISSVSVITKCDDNVFSTGSIINIGGHVKTGDVNIHVNTSNLRPSYRKVKSWFPHIL